MTTLLKQLRKKMNLSEGYTASILQCSVDEYREIESGITKPTTEQLQTLERLFILSPDKLLTEMTLSEEESLIQDLLEFQRKLK